MEDFLRQLLQSLVDGLATGSVYAMIALGYTLVYGIIKLINFAHGEFYMIGAYIAYFIFASPLTTSASPVVFSLVLLLMLIATCAGTSALAVFTEKIAYKPIRRYDRVVALLTAIGISFLLQNLARLTFGAQSRGYVGIASDRPDSAAATFLDWYTRYTNFAGIEIQNAKILIMIIAAVSMTGLYFLIMHTRMGKAMRCTSQDMEAARLMGIDTDAVISRTFALGGAFAGIAGLLYGMLSGVDPMMGFIPGLKAFVAAVVGGIGSIPGAVLGGLALGLAENLAIFANLDTAYKDAVAFALLVIILLFRPNGILGVQRKEKV